MQPTLAWGNGAHGHHCSLRLQGSQTAGVWYVVAARTAAATWWQLPVGHAPQRQQLHRIQRCFGCAAFFTFTPQSYSGRVLNAAVMLATSLHIPLKAEYISSNCWSMRLA